MSDRGPDPTRPQGDIEETPEAGAAPLQPPAWRDQFADPILQPGEQYDPQRRAAAPPAAQGQAAGDPAAPPTADPAASTPVPPAEPAVETVLEPGQISADGVARAARDFAEATPEQRSAQARQLADRMRPLAADAATFASRALNLGAKGLAGLAARLGRRGDPNDKTGG